MPTKITTNPLSPGKIFHIFNRGNEKTRIFYKPSNYQHFIDLYNHYMKDWVNTYAYCLIPNHFHLLVQIKANGNKEDEYSASQQFRKFFIAYAMGINKQQSRKGSLFQRPFRRQLISTNLQLRRVVYYIHNNPAKHQLTDDYKSFRYSSYNEIIKQRSQIIDFNTVLSWFQGIDEFIEYHEFLSNPQG